MPTRFGFVSTYPPTACGLATFTSSLHHALTDHHADDGWVVTLVDENSPRPSREVVAQVRRGDLADLNRAADRLNACDVVIIQHEYGIYGGPDGGHVLNLLDRLEVPAIVVLHTVLASPSVRQRRILETLAMKAASVVTMTDTARERLATGYRVDMSKVLVIPHGAPDMTGSSNSVVLRDDRFTALTWGLLGPGKGIEWAIAAMGMVADLPQAPRYVIAGRTHPAVVARQGESYREGLQAQVRELGLRSSVEFDSRYHDAASLAALVQAADVVLLPYDSTEQVTSGVLIEAVAAGKPVIATEFPHARELLAHGAGLLVPHRDPGAIADALRSLITHRELGVRMSQAAAAEAPGLMWSVVAGHYRVLASRLIRATVAA